MSEMSAEKKKQIERYIIKSYFGGGKNVESLANGADTIKGTDDGYIPQLIVEVTYFGESGVVMIKWNIYGDSQQNSFSMHICREREIERNRCDSVDAMSYAWEAWRSKIQGKPIFLKTNDEDLQKDKRIEELEKEVKALKDENEVMERHIHELKSHNISLAETNAVLKNRKESYLRMVQTGAGYLKDWEEATGCSKPEHVKKKIYALENECRVGHDTADHQLEQIHGLEDEVNKFYDMFDCCEPAYVKQRINKMKDEIENLNKKLKECEKDYISKRDEAERLEKEIGIYSRALNEWKDATGCTAPRQAIIRIRGLENAVRRADRNMLKELDSEIDEWQKATGCDSPEEAKEKLGGFVQAASCAEKHLEHILLWRPEQTGQEVE